MDKVITIYDAKTNLSKLIKKVRAGETIYIGAYGRAEAVIAPLPGVLASTSTPKRQLGILAYKQAKAYDSSALVQSDPEIAAEFEASAHRPLL